MQQLRSAFTLPQGGSLRRNDEAGRAHLCVFHPPMQQLRSAFTLPQGGSLRRNDEAGMAHLCFSPSHAAVAICFHPPSGRVAEEERRSGEGETDSTRYCCNGKPSLSDKNRSLEIACGSTLECASIDDVLVVCDPIDVESQLPGTSALQRMVSTLSRWLQQPTSPLDCSAKYESHHAECELSATLKHRKPPEPLVGSFLMDDHTRRL
jgi:hypothetical protein